MEQYIVMAEIVKQILEHGSIWWVPASVLCWKLPDLIAAVAALVK